MTAATLNAEVRDAFNETAPAKVTTAGDIVYATAARTLARLGIGSARRLLRVNAAGTAPEWFRPTSVRARRTSDQTISHATDTAIQFNASDRWDDNSWHDTSSNNTRITPDVAGRILVGGHVEWESQGTDSRHCYIRLNGTTSIGGARYPAAGTVIQSVVTLYEFNGSSDYVELVVNQNTGSGLDILASGNYSPEFWAQWLGPS